MKFPYCVLQISSIEKLRENAYLRKYLPTIAKSETFANVNIWVLSEKKF